MPPMRTLVRARTNKSESYNHNLLEKESNGGLRQINSSLTSTDLKFSCKNLNLPLSVSKKLSTRSKMSKPNSPRPSSEKRKIDWLEINSERSLSLQLITFSNLRKRSTRPTRHHLSHLSS